ncbi:MAG: hypothetical protein KatS3mg054_0763 [Chloroflexus sp.]|nr:MAG: hypothetical protein KatS3mg054_0763 [Chloroflexus sp.]GIV93762.1 MAG: hypothetical protein KatS3mg056_2471 [Chloroflexus sp.]
MGSGVDGTCKCVRKIGPGDTLNALTPGPLPCNGIGEIRQTLYQIWQDTVHDTPSPLHRHPTVTRTISAVIDGS